MNIKQKIIRSKDEQARSRYDLQIKSFQPGSSLLRGKEGDHDKENSINQLNKSKQRPNLALQKSQEIQVINSIELCKDVKYANDQEQKYNCGNNQLRDPEDLRSSHQMFIFRQKSAINRTENASLVGNSTKLILGNQKRKDFGLMTSRQFLEQKKVKNEVIDEMFVNVRRGLYNSCNDGDFQARLNCVNHRVKRAKYRLLSQLSEGETEMFYCSKCAINLLQQGFRVEEISSSEVCEGNRVRGELIGKLQLRLKSLQERNQAQIQSNEQNEELDLIEEQIGRSNDKFKELIDLMERLRRESVAELRQLFQKKQLQQRIHRQSLLDISKEMEDVEEEIRQYKVLNKFSSMNKGQFQFISSSLANRVNGWEEMMNSVSMSEHEEFTSSQGMGYDFILAKLQQYITDKQEDTLTRRDREKSFHERQDSIATRHGEEEFVCEQKKPFRILFPCEESYPNRIAMPNKPQRKTVVLNSMREYPSFKQFPPL